MPVKSETFRELWAQLVHTNFGGNLYGPIMGPYLFLVGQFVWTNGPESPSKVSPYAGIGPWMAFPSQTRSIAFWEKLNRGVSKPGCFPLFSGKVQIVSRTLSGMFLVGALNRPRKRKRTNRENPRTIPAQIGKIPEKSGKSQKGQKRTKKEGQVQIGKPPRLKPPRLAALEHLSRQVPWGLTRNSCESPEHDSTHNDILFCR